MPVRFAVAAPAAALLALVAAAAPTPRADDQDVDAVLQELALPPLRPGVPDAVSPEVRRAFDPAAMREHAPDVPPAAVEKDRARYPGRAATLDALVAVRKRWPGGPGVTARFRETLPDTITDALRKTVLGEQEWPALAVAEIEDALRDLERSAASAERDSKRWQAHHAYVSAHLRLRLAFVLEYNLALAMVRTDRLPPLDPAAHRGWRLTPTESLKSNKAVKDTLRTAHAALDAVARDHKGTPWASLAERDRQLSVGLRWEPAGGK